MNFSRLKEMPIYSKDMELIGKLIDVDIDLETHRVSQYIAKVEGKKAKKVWKDRLPPRSPKIAILTEQVLIAKDAIQLPYTLDEAKDKLKKV